MRKTTQLRTLINDKEILLLPGIYDALSARIAERPDRLGGDPGAVGCELPRDYASTLHPMA